jgi:DnaJ-class molecular chaperone
MSKYTELYDILNLPVTCTTDDIKKSYKKKAIILHPDKGGNKEEFQKLNQAYEILSNSDKRNHYNKTGSVTNDVNSNNVNSNDIFSNIFQGFQGFPGFPGFPGFSGFQQKQKCSPIQVILPVTLNELYCGIVKKVNYNRQILCINCNGKGANKVNKCNKCNGSGKKVFSTQIGPNMLQQQITDCDKCKSTGVIYDIKDKCNECNGQKLINIENTLDIEILPGMVDKQVITFEYFGNEILNSCIPGDVIIILEQQKHDYFERQENNLIYKMNISIGEALLGFSNIIVLPDNKKVVIKVDDKCTPSHSKFEIKDYGMPILNTNTKGYLIIKIIVQFPNSLSVEEKETIRSVFSIKSNLDKNII